VSLILDDCVGLVEVHGSVGFIDKFVDLSLAHCFNLRSFLRSLKLKSLKFHVLCACLRLKNFSEIESEMKCLEYIDFEEIDIEELPSFIGNLVGAKELNLGGCTNFMNLPDSIHQLQHLEFLNPNGCTSIKWLPSSYIWVLSYGSKMRSRRLHKPHESTKKHLSVAKFRVSF
jgi:hypothetical protein